jgi:hypothetical protein
MKRTILFLLAATTAVSCLFAQTTKNPFSELGYKKQVMYTSSKGEFEEFHGNPDVVEIGSVYFNTKTNKVIGYVNQEKEKAEVATATSAMSVDPKCEKYYWISPYAYCLNNPVNAVDPDGRLVIFINGMHGGSGGKSEYWKGLDTQVMNRIKDWNATYIDGSHGGTSSLPWNLSANERKDVGYDSGKDYASYYLFAYKNDDGSFKESIKVITHSMGAAYAKGFIKGLIDAGVPINQIEFEADFAPFQPTKQQAVNGVRTYQFSHKNDDVANNKLLGSPSGKIEGVSNSDYSNADNENKVHAIETFTNEVNNLPAGTYKVVDGKIVRN